MWVERIFAVVLTGAALFYLSLAFVPKVAAYVVPFTLIAGGLYLGFIEPSARDKTGLKRIKWVFGGGRGGDGLCEQSEGALPLLARL